MIPDLERRLARNLEVIMGEIVAPPRSRLERALLWCRVPEPTARLVAATPVLRWSWAAAVAVLLLFAVSSGDATWDAADRLAVLLAIAPVVPVIGVAAAYGPHADRAHEVHLVAPLSGLRLLLLRSVTVVVAAAAITALTMLVAPTDGVLRLAWLLPSLATTTVALALGARVGVRRAATIVCLTWLSLVIVVAQLADDATAPFRVVGQIACAAVVLFAGCWLVHDRRRFDRAPSTRWSAP